MVHLLVELSKYFMIVLILVYTLESFLVLRYANRKNPPRGIYRSQRTILFTMHFDAFVVLYLTTENTAMIGFYIMQVLFFAATFLLFRLFHKNANEQLLNNMCMLMCIGMIILTRLSYEKAFRQFIFMGAGLVLMLLFPVIIRGTTSFFRKLTWVYAVIGIAALLVVCIAGTTSYGAKLSLTIAGVSIQPSEFVKIIFVFFMASILYRAQSVKDLMVASVVAAIFVLILVASKDLGGALLYFFTYLVMIYMATKKIACFGVGLLGMGAAALVGYQVFSHVQTRVIAWLDPLSVIDDEGYQISQSLFAIGTGGWFGLGLNQGMPSKIPVVEKDFVFAAISEEMGGIFALCVIMICISCFLMIFNISMQLKEPFYRLVAMGLGTVYAFQVFLTIGGVTKFIPSTGVTLPLVSYGGSSLLSTMILFGVIQALYVMRADEEERERELAEQRALAETAGITRTTMRTDTSGVPNRKKGKQTTASAETSSFKTSRKTADNKKGNIHGRKEKEKKKSK